MRVILATVAALTLATPSFGCDAKGGEMTEAIPNVRLGMAPRDVRERFRPSGEGSWQTAVGSGDDTVVEWTLRDEKARSNPTAVIEARFEFHLGMLVAIRARSNETTSSEKIGLTPKTVTIRSPAREGGTMITVLARDCPTHKDEAESIAAKAR